MKRIITCTLSFIVACNQVTQPVPPVPDVVSIDASCVASKLEPTSSSEPIPRNVLIVGDSEACAVGFIADKVANERLPHDNVSVECKGGTTVQYWGSGGHLRQALVRHPASDVVLVFLGTNHYWQKETPPVGLILDLIRDSNVKCVWVGNTAVKGKKWPINGLLRGAVTPTCSYFDTEAADVQLWDGVHPDRANALRWLRMVWSTIPTKHE